MSNSFLSKEHRLLAFALSWILGPFLGPAYGEDSLIADFEADGYRGWSITGTAFGDEPARGTLAHQMPVSGYVGERLVNTFSGGDASVGTATSPEFTITQSHVAFLIGGGSHLETVGMQLLVDDRVTRSATGADSEELTWSSWNVREFIGKRARIKIYDQATGGWGHINVDQIIQTDTPPSRFGLEEKLQTYRQSADYLQEPWRPQLHFTPEIHWMNDPNGLVYHEGEYHLFYQYNPAGNVWGHMSWGHAVSTDLVHWKHLPLAIPEENGVMAFSGSCVVDHQNSSGLGVGTTPPLIAIYTGHGHGKQVQNVAYSNDRGRTWTQYAGNPVIDLSLTDFRDPKVFWHQPTKRWVMAVSLAVEKIIVLYGSDNLLDWTELSRFGPAGTTQKANWECPDLFELPIEGSESETMWVLEADMGSGSIAGGSGGEYFVGTFDGVRFMPTQEAQWVDFGRDFYAPISFSDIPESDGRRIWLGWMNNWETALQPTSPWRSSMSIPRVLSLRNRNAHDTKLPADYVLIQKPVEELKKLRSMEQPLDTSKAAWPPVAITEKGSLSERSFELELKLNPGEARSCGIRLRSGVDEFLEIGYDRDPGVVYVDRRQAGNVDFHPAFAGRYEAPVRLIDRSVILQIIVDRSTSEVFINDGEAVISNCFFPNESSPVIEVFTGDASASVTDAKLWTLKSIWKP